MYSCAFRSTCALSRSLFKGPHGSTPINQKRIYLDTLQQKLQQGSEQLGLSLTQTQTEKLLAYIREFDKWNKAYNLSAVRDIQEMIPRHLLDSLSLVSHVQALPGQRLLDVGTGGGLPGIPLAIMFPEREFTLLDSNGKKTRFLFHVKTALQLDNVQVENRRVEAFTPGQGFDVILSRAFASLADMARDCAHLLASGGVFAAMKGIYPADELTEVADGLVLVGSLPLAVPDTRGERHLLLLKPIGS